MKFNFSLLCNTLNNNKSISCYISNLDHSIDFVSEDKLINLKLKECKDNLFQLYPDLYFRLCNDIITDLNLDFNIDLNLISLHKVKDYENLKIYHPFLNFDNDFDHYLDRESLTLYNDELSHIKPTISLHNTFQNELSFLRLFRFEGLKSSLRNIHPFPSGYTRLLLFFVIFFSCIGYNNFAVAFYITNAPMSLGYEDDELEEGAAYFDEDLMEDWEYDLAEYYFFEYMEFFYELDDAEDELSVKDCYFNLYSNENEFLTAPIYQYFDNLSSLTPNVNTNFTLHLTDKLYDYYNWLNYFYDVFGSSIFNMSIKNLNTQFLKYYENLKFSKLNRNSPFFSLDKGLLDIFSTDEKFSSFFTAFDSNKYFTPDFSLSSNGFGNKVFFKMFFSSLYYKFLLVRNYDTNSFNYKLILNEINDYASFLHSEKKLLSSINSFNSCLHSFSNALLKHKLFLYPKKSYVKKHDFEYYEYLEYGIFTEDEILKLGKETDNYNVFIDTFFTAEGIHACSNWASDLIFSQRWEEAHHGNPQKYNRLILFFTLFFTKYVFPNFWLYHKFKPIDDRPGLVKRLWNSGIRGSNVKLLLNPIPFIYNKKIYSSFASELEHTPYLYRINKKLNIIQRLTLLKKIKYINSDIDSKDTLKQNVKKSMDHRLFVKKLLYKYYLQHKKFIRFTRKELKIIFNYYPFLLRVCLINWKEINLIENEILKEEAKKAYLRDQEIKAKNPSFFLKKEKYKISWDEFIYKTEEGEFWEVFYKILDSIFSIPHESNKFRFLCFDDIMHNITDQKGVQYLTLHDLSIKAFKDSVETQFIKNLLTYQPVITHYSLLNEFDQKCSDQKVFTKIWENEIENNLDLYLQITYKQFVVTGLGSYEQLWSSVGFYYPYIYRMIRLKVLHRLYLKQITKKP